MGSQITYEERTGANDCEMYYAYDNTGKLYGFYYYGSGPDSFYFYKRNVQGRFINADDFMGQTGALLSHNLFAYCQNNPVIHVDQSGRLFMLVAGLVGAVVGAVVGGVIAAATGGDILKGALIGGLTGGLMGLTCGAAASLVATGGATAFASTGVVMGTNTMLTATGSTVMVASEVAAVNAMSAPKLFELGQKLVKYISKRGWSADIINNTIRNPIFTGNTTNLTTGNPATAYFLSDNQYVVIDNITRQLVQLSNLADAAWKVDSRIILEVLY